MSEQKQGFIKRTGTGVLRYTGKRFGNTFINEVGRETVFKGANEAKEALTPEDLDTDEFKAGLRGRYKDGGSEKFAEQMRMSNVDIKDLPGLAEHRKTAALIMYIAAAFFFALGCYMMFTAETGSKILYGFSTSFVSLVFISIGVRHDFSRWQIEQRRFGGFREFLNAKSSGNKTGRGLTTK